MKEEQPDVLTPEQLEINEKREAYMNAVEGHDGGLTGKVKQIIRAIKGGKMSADGELVMIVDAQGEDDLRNNEDSRLKNYEKSYLRFEPVEVKLRSAFGEEISRSSNLVGVIDGKEVKITTGWSIERQKWIIAGGTIDGEEISRDGASIIYHEFFDIAKLQEWNTESARTDEELEKIKQKEEKEEEAARARDERTKNLLKKMIKD